MTKVLLFALCFWSLSAFAESSALDLGAPQAPAPTPGFSIRTAANYDDLRHTIGELIASSKKRVWILTDFLSDGDIATALLLSKQRRLDVKVFFGRDKLNAPSSRISFLKTQGVQVYIRPTHGFVAPTLLFVDQKLFTVNRDLNGQNRFGSSQIVQASPEEVKSFVIWLRGVMEYPEIAVPRYTPRMRGTIKEPFQGDSDGSYNYDRGGGWKKAPEGVSRELPKVLRWKKIQQEKDGSPPEALNAPAVPATEPATTPTPEATEKEADQSAKPPKQWITPEPAPDTPAGPSDEERASDPPKEEQQR